VNILQFIKWCMIDQYIFGIDAGDPPAGDPPAGDPPAGDPPAGDPPAGDPPAPWHQSLPETWRNDLAGEDEGRLNDFNRYTDFSKWVESGFEAKATIRKGELSTGLPDEPSDEQLTAYREANGIPETSDKYELSLEPGVELSEMEKEIMASVQEVAHLKHLPASTLSAITGAWIASKSAQLERMADQDGLDIQRGESTMRDHWKQDYDKNMGAATSLLAGLPDVERDLLMNGRDGEGRPLMSRPYFLQFLAESALKINPMANLPGGGSNPVGTADAIIQKVKDIFARNDPDEVKAYYRDAELNKQYDQAIAVKQQAGQSI
jgi:hypothetical protein